MKRNVSQTEHVFISDFYIYIHYILCSISLWKKNYMYYLCYNILWQMKSSSNLQNIYYGEHYEYDLNLTEKYINNIIMALDV